MDQKDKRPAPPVGGAHRATERTHFDTHTLNRSPQRPQATLNASVITDALGRGAIAKVGPSELMLGRSDALDALRRAFPNDDEHRWSTLIGEFVVCAHAVEFFGHNHVMNRRLPLRTLKLVIEQATGNCAMRSDALLAALARGLFEI